MSAAKAEKELRTLPETTMEKGDRLKQIRDLAALNNKFEDLKTDNQILKTNLSKSDEKLAALNNKFEALETDNQILKTNLNKADQKVTELYNEMEYMHKDQEIMKANLIKAEQEVKLLYKEKKALEEVNKRLHSVLEREQKHRLERKHSGSTSIMNHDELFEHTRDDHWAVDIPGLSSGRGQQQQQQQQQQHDQLSSEGEEPTELDPKDKGLFNFLKAVSNVACTATNAFNVGFSVLAYTASGRHTTSEAQKLVLTIGGVLFMPFSIVTAGMVHALEGRAKDIDIATGHVFAEISYAFLAICLVAMFVGKAPWFIVVPIFFVMWSLTISWLVSQYRRPRALYRRLRSVKKRFKDKAQRE